MEVLNLTRDVFVKNQYEKVVDTQFTQLVTPAPSLIVSQSLPTVNEFLDTTLNYSIKSRKQGKLILTNI